MFLYDLIKNNMFIEIKTKCVKYVLVSATNRTPQLRLACVSDTFKYAIQFCILFFFSYLYIILLNGYTIDIFLSILQNKLNLFLKKNQFNEWLVFIICKVKSLELHKKKKNCVLKIPLHFNQFFFVFDKLCWTAIIFLKE